MVKAALQKLSLALGTALCSSPIYSSAAPAASSPVSSLDTCAASSTTVVEETEEKRLREEIGDKYDSFQINCVPAGEPEEDRVRRKQEIVETVLNLLREERGKAGTREERAAEEKKAGEKERKARGFMEKEKAGEEYLEQKTTLRSAFRDTPVRDLTFRLNLEYDFWGGKKVVRATSEGQIKDVDLRPQVLDVSLNLGLDGYLVLGAGVASTDSATSFTKPANFSAVRNNVRLGAGYEINRGYRAEAEGILVRHAELLSGIQARVVGDLFGVNYGPINDVDVQLGVNLIPKIPHLTAQVGTRFLNRYYTSLSSQFSTKEAQVALTTAFCHEVERVRVKGCLGTEVFYHKFEGGREQGFLTKLKMELPEFPYDRRAR